MFQCLVLIEIPFTFNSFLDYTAENAILTCSLLPEKVILMHSMTVATSEVGRQIKNGRIFVFERRCDG
jgi:hypothetical protein